MKTSMLLPKFNTAQKNQIVKTRLSNKSRSLIQPLPKIMR